MGKPKGSPKTGGRVKGTPNKLSSCMRSNVKEILSEYTSSERMLKDFRALEPKERLFLAEKLMNYYMPKMQATAVTNLADDARKTIEDQLVELSE